MDVIEGDPVPIDRLMLHHIVFLNTGPAGSELRASTHGIFDGDNLRRSPPSSASSPPARSGRKHGDARRATATTCSKRRAAAQRTWAVLYMVMNHKAETDSAFIEYTVTDRRRPAEARESADPTGASPSGWTPRTASADPIYNVPGTGTGGRPTRATRTSPTSRSTRRARARPAGGSSPAPGTSTAAPTKLDLSQPTCGDRTLADVDARPGASRPPLLQREADPARARPDQHERVRDPAGLPDPCGPAAAAALGLRQHPAAHPGDGDHDHLHRARRERAGRPLYGPALRPTSSPRRGPTGARGSRPSSGCR